MKFHSERLQATFEQAKARLEQITPLTDIISQDIQQLEHFLQTLDLNYSVSFNLKSATTLKHHEELLVWDHRKQRIFYLHNAFSVSCIADNTQYYPYIHFNDKEVLIEVPLSEADIEIQERLWREDKLALFLSFLTQNSVFNVY